MDQNLIKPFLKQDFQKTTLCANCLIKQYNNYINKFFQKQMISAAPTMKANQLSYIISDSGPDGDNSYVFLTLDAIEAQGLKQGQLVHITEPSRRKDTLALIQLDESVAQPQAIKMNHICRKNLAAQVGDFVHINIFKEPCYMSKMVVKKIGGFASQATPEKHEETQLMKYFADMYRPICRDDVFQIKTHLGTMEFFITYTEPAIYGYVTEDTMIAIDWDENQKKNK